MRKHLRRVLMVAALLGVVVLVAWMLRPTPTPVDVASVVRGSMLVTIDSEGQTRVSERFVVTAPAVGRLSRITLERGDFVQRGAVLATISPPPVQPLDPRQVAEARARVAAAESVKLEADAIVERVATELGLARSERERAERLAATGDISIQQVEQLRSSEVALERQLEAGRFRAQAAASDLEATRALLRAFDVDGFGGSSPLLIRAPVSGQVLKIFEESERVVQPGTPLLEMSNPAGLEVVVDVLSTDAVRIQPGTRVLLEGWGGDAILNAHVRLIEPSAFTKVSALGVEEQRVNVIADFVDPPGPLGDGYRVEARFVIWEGNNVLKVPSSSLFRIGQQWAVFVVEEGRVRRREVVTGNRTSFEVQVLEGLDEGSRVLLHPSSDIQEGLPVEPRERQFE